MLVGDLIMSVREAATDLPQTMILPGIVSATGVSFGGGTLNPGTYYLQVTATNQWGQTLPSAETPVTVGAGQNAIQLFVFGPPGNTGNIRVYVGLGSNLEFQYVPFTVINFSNSLTITSLAGAIAGAPPSRNSAYLPDTDGDAVSAYAMFRWINDALKLASQVCGGLPDYGGVGSIVGSPQYVLPGLWKKIASVWYDGYPLAMDDTGNYFRRNAITASVLSSIATGTFNNQMIIELWPQPARTAAQTQLAAQMLIGQTSAQLFNASGFLLTNGFVLIGTEICSYSGISGNTLTNLQRGLGGTVQSVIVAGTQVQELNLFWNGWREYNPNFQPGSSGVVVPVPLGWETILFEYGLSRMKLAEQNVGDYSKLNDSCIKKFSDWYRTNKVTTGPRQIGDQTMGLETLPNLGGGWVIPALFPIVCISEKCYHLFGGGAWSSISIACVILGMALSVMLEKRTTQRSGRLRTSLSRCWSMVGQRLYGFLNYEHLDSGRNSKFSKSVMKTRGENESAFGFSITVGYGNFLTHDWAEKLFLHEQKKAMQSNRNECSESRALPQLEKKYPPLSRAILSVKLLGKLLGKLIGSNSPTLKSEKNTDSQSRIGGQISHQKNEQLAWKEQEKRVSDDTGGSE